ncbi:MAG: type II toxin-antitoxin system RelE/ParE family toxin [Rhodospirillales bacterium]
MRLFKVKAFTRFANREGIVDTDLSDAVRRAEEGLIDADLGGGVIKQRIARRDELRAFRKLADEMLPFDDDALSAAMRNGTISEIICHE